MLSFIYAEKDSYKDYGIKITKRPSLPSPKRKVTYAEIPGRDSSIRYDEGTYQDITIAVECSITGDDVIEQLDRIKEWLFTSGERDLIFSFQNNRKYRAQVVNSIDFKQVFRVASKFVIIFNCRPFKYDVVNQVETITGSPGFIINKGSVECKPIIKVFGTGDVILEINSKKINLYNIIDYITIDSVLMDTYKDTELLNNSMLGEFPVLQPGINNITWIGLVTKIEITPNFRYL